MSFDELKCVITQEQRVRGNLALPMVLEVLKHGVNFPLWDPAEGSILYTHLLHENMPPASDMALQRFGYISPIDIYRFLCCEQRSLQEYWADMIAQYSMAVSPNHG